MKLAPYGSGIDAQTHHRTKLINYTRGTQSHIELRDGSQWGRHHLLFYVVFPKDYSAESAVVGEKKARETFIARTVDQQPLAKLITLRCHYITIINCTQPLIN